MLGLALNPALELSRSSEEGWGKLVIDWLAARAKATLTNLGRGSLNLVLDSETFSSNGVLGKSLYEVTLHTDEGEAHEAWEADWTHPGSQVVVSGIVEAMA